MSGSSGWSLYPEGIVFDWGFVVIKWFSNDFEKIWMFLEKWFSKDLDRWFKVCDFRCGSSMQCLRGVL